MIIVPSYIGLWLLQIFCILFPMLLFQSYFRKKFGQIKVQKTIFSVLCGISIIICMTFPVSISKDYILDFRFIPLIMAFLFGGYRVGLFLSILLMSYRFMIGGMGFYLGGLWMTVLLLVAFHYTIPRSGKMNPKFEKSYPYLLLTISLVFFALGTQFLDDYSFSQQEFVLWLWFSIFNFITFWMALFFQNSMREMEDMTTKVIQFEKNHTINHMLVYISQQMISPLKSAEGFLNMVQEEPVSSSQSYHLLQTKNELKQAVRCLDHYLTFMGEKWEEQGDLSFITELEQVVELMKSYADMHQVDLIYTSTADDQIAIKGDPSLLRFALLNIIKNAIEACSPNGRVNICLHEMLKEVYIIVEDNGSGIPAKILNQLGQPLPSGKVNGTGLGLASTYKITESMGGRVEVESTPNEGTTFSLYFPKWAI
ncbi:ATP-binding protein [Neobacillus sp. PS3-40]|uniref:ATP-binding protein n=1 Tax=Neobacillus sp. PS3-40 TaxID=3070679 RepID=UPI0027E06572|nr:ATP-binding protein [Neobacillus sp. PS3-40]WML43471.1 ATP-binding protein [Neobacillus sp. PS3-40]